MLEIFSDMAEGILDQLGEDAFLAGATTPIKINIEHGVQLAGIGSEDAQYRGDLVANRDVATILAKYQPAARQTFTFAPTATPGYAGRTFRIEFLAEDNGVTKRFVIMEVV